jgi:hypothetical protein
MKTQQRSKATQGSVPPEVLAGTELGTKEHAAKAAKLSVRSIENHTKRRAIPVIRVSPRCVRFHIPSVLSALRKFEIHAVAMQPTNGRAARKEVQ